MFKLNDRVFYPFYGVGFFINVEEHDIQRELQTYYKIYIPDKQLDIFVPIDNAQRLGLRRIEKIENLDSISNIEYNYKDHFEVLGDNKKQIFLKKLRLGTLENHLQLTRDLQYTIWAKINLHYEEKNLLKIAHNMFVQEIRDAVNLSEKEAIEFIEKDFKEILKNYI
ncbi:CarD family transcriptional regulator [Bacillus mesophilum]|uniref:CarD-like/TRCF RNAP-interacting domain-containing protein n=1 Tax=Bacillus mesophilum TaxID=1071718 RepID=A0A7V7V0F0_9BACI|nr:CarD family transcriptional regulator [Bacillus mesophilum]KAB2335132.1 hypothetical protein F7732_00745 [Bacillus mesophilum]